jgi:hypothetical protein
VAEQPTCPHCKSAVGPSWDWCHTCGYDPAGLKPADWVPDTAPTQMAPAPATAPPPVPVPSRPAATAPADAPGQTWVAPAPAGRARPGPGPVTTLVDPGDARPQEMRDPDWVQHEPRHGLPVPALVGLVAVVAAAVVGLVIVTLIVLHRPIGTTDDGAQRVGAAPVISSSPF